MAGLDLVLPSTCAGCGSPGVMLCGTCRGELFAAVLPPAAICPSPPPPGWPGCRAVLRYDGVVARLVRDAKDGGRRDLLPVLGRVLADGVSRACDDLVGRDALLVAAPSARSTRRRRGDSPVEEMTRHAARALDRAASAAPVLRVVRPVRDQAGLGGHERHRNLDGAMALAGGRSVRDRSCVVVDDVVTSGATMAEARRVLLAGGAREVALASLAATPRRKPVLPSRGGLT